MLTPLLLLLACAGSPPAADSATPWVPPGCGDGVLDADEECDEGAANSDTTADACRESCLAPRCGDGVQDANEACDDGGPWGGDGCTPTCLLEEGQLEVEPNDDADSAEDWSGDLIFGSLSADDQDCFAFDLPSCAAVSARLLPPCAEPATLRLHDPTGAELAVGSPDEEGCATLDPAENEGARFTTAGRWSLCVAPLLDHEVAAWELEISTIDPSEASFPSDSSEDQDGDGFVDRCDTDRDGDGVLDEEDNCPDIPNGPDAGAFTPDADGFLTTWLAAGPYTGTTSADSCLPSDDDLVAESDALAAPSLGLEAGEVIWFALLSEDARIELLDDFSGVDAPREAYLAAYIYNETERTVTLALGPDDGARAWLGEELLLDVSSCQGTNVDQFQAETTLPTGWSRLMLKIRDQGGGWGTYARFLDSEGAAITDLEISLDPDPGWIPDQSDQDGDGEGDLCDHTPLG